MSFTMSSSSCWHSKSEGTYRVRHGLNARSYLDIFRKIFKIDTIAAFSKGLGQFQQLFFINESSPESYVFDTSDVQSLALFNYLNRVRSLHTGMECPCIQPRCASAHGRHFKFSFLEISVVDIGDFKFTPGARLDR